MEIATAYAFEQLETAVSILAGHHGRLRDRLEDARTSRLIRLSTRHFPPSLQASFAAIELALGDLSNVSDESRDVQIADDIRALCKAMARLQRRPYRQDHRELAA